MEELRRVHQLRLVVYPIIYKVLYIPGGFLAGFLNHQQYVIPLAAEEKSTTSWDDYIYFPASHTILFIRFRDLDVSHQQGLRWIVLFWNIAPPQKLANNDMLNPL